LRGPGARVLTFGAGLLLSIATIPVVAEGGEVTLSFGDAPGGASHGFRIERRASGAEGFAAVALVGPGVSEFVDRGLPDGKRYCYRVRSLLASASEWSPEVCAVAEPEGAAAPAPPPPTGASEAPAEAAPPIAEPAPEPEPQPAAEGAPAESATGEPAPAEPRRIRTSGGWLQVLD
jgi:hypothetical protein